MADLWAQQYVAFEAIYASRFSTKFNIHRIYSKNALGGEEGGAWGYISNRQIVSFGTACIFMTYVA